MSRLVVYISSVELLRESKAIQVLCRPKTKMPTTVCMSTSISPDGKQHNTLTCQVRSKPEPVSIADCFVLQKSYYIQCGKYCRPPTTLLLTYVQYPYRYFEFWEPTPQGVYITIARDCRQCKKPSNKKIEIYQLWEGTKALARLRLYERMVFPVERIPSGLHARGALAILFRHRFGSV